MEYRDCLSCKYLKDDNVYRYGKPSYYCDHPEQKHKVIGWPTMMCCIKWERWK